MIHDIFNLFMQPTTFGIAQLNNWWVALDIFLNPTNLDHQIRFYRNSFTQPTLQLVTRDVSFCYL